MANRHVNVRSGTEEPFALSLKAGSYRFDQLAAQGFANFFFPVVVKFEVAPGATTYVGTLEITIPYRMYEGPAAFRVLDRKEETLQALKIDQAASSAEMRTSLMTIGP